MSAPDLMLETPLSYARRCASYIASPTKIESLTRLEFGRAPPLHVIAQMRLKVEQEAKQLKAGYTIPEDYRNYEIKYERDFRVGSLVKEPAVRRYPEHPGCGTAYKVAHVKARPEPPKINSPLATDIIKAVADAFMVPVEAMIGPGRSTQMVAARAVAIRLLRDERMSDGSPRFSLPGIARLVGRKDHSTISHALETFEARAAAHPAVAEVYAALKRLAE